MRRRKHRNMPFASGKNLDVNGSGSSFSLYFHNASLRCVIFKQVINQAQDHLKVLILQVLIFPQILLSMLDLDVKKLMENIHQSTCQVSIRVIIVVQ